MSTDYPDYPYHYPNLTIEMRRKHITADDIIRVVKPSKATIRHVLCEHEEIDMRDFIIIRNTFFPKLPLKYLLLHNRTKYSGDDDTSQTTYINAKSAPDR